MLNIRRICKYFSLCFVGIFVCAMINYLYPKSLVDFLEAVRPEMKRSDVSAIIPVKLLISAEMADKQAYCADRVFNETNKVFKILTYYEEKGGRFAHAQIFLDKDEKVIGLTYTGDGFRPLKQTIFDGTGPKKSRKYLSAQRSDNTIGK